MDQNPAGLIAPSLLLACSILASSASSAAIPSSLRTACEDKTGGISQYVFCNDGIPEAGGRTANVQIGPGGPVYGVQAVTVPARYDSDTVVDNNPADEYVGLPAKVIDTPLPPGADSNGDIAIDLDVSFPTAAPPPGGHPLIVYTHGCCAGTKANWQADEPEPDGQRWHYNNAWFASRGYVVINMTVRGFTHAISSKPESRGGSTGEAGLMSRSLEINDYQHIACQLYSDMEGGNWDNLAGTTAAPRINPQKVVVAGGSYAGGFSYMALTDPIWSCNSETGSDGTEMKLVAAAPMYTWTDLVYALVPTGRHFVEPGNLPRTDGCDSGPRAVAIDGTYSDCGSSVFDISHTNPVGIPKATIVAGLFGTGAGATFPPKLLETFRCIGQSNAYPPESAGKANCQSATDPIGKVLPEFIRDRSAYYQHRFFALIQTNPEYRVPLFSMATTTDPLFPMSEHRRMHGRILAAVPDYPLKSYFGDYQHFVQNKAKEWDDLCGDDHHICKVDDYPGGDFNQPPTDLRRVGVLSHINRFLDHYAQPVANPNEPAPALDVTASVQVCPENATDRWPADEPGERFSAASFEALRTGTLSVTTADGSLISIAAMTTSEVPGNRNAQSGDPVIENQNNTPRQGCHLLAAQGEQGIAVFETAPLAEELLMVGPAALTLDFAVQGDTNSLQLNTRMYDVFPSAAGTQVPVAIVADRGPRRISSPEASQTSPRVTYALQGNVYRFAAGNKIRFEIFQDEDPGFLKDSDPPSSTTIGALGVSIPQRKQAGPVITVSSLAVVPQNSGGAPGATVPAGSFSLTNNSGQPQTLSSISLNVTNSGGIAGLTASYSGTDYQLTPTGNNDELAFSPAITIARDATITLSMTARLAGGQLASIGLNRAWADSSTPQAGASLTIVFLLALLIAYASVRSASLQRKVPLALLLAAMLMVAGCGGGRPGNDSVTSSGGSVISLVAVALAGSIDGSPASPAGLPVTLATVRSN